MSTLSLPTIAVVGGGCSGTLTAAQLLRQATAPLRIVLIERRPVVGRGVAYGTTDAGHLLNVPAGKISALPEDPDHFLRWLQAPGAGEDAPRLPDSTPGTFAPRRLFGTYLGELLADAATSAAPGVTLEHVAAEATDVVVTESGVRLALSDETTVHADRAVLAVGHGTPLDPGGVDAALAVDPRYVRDPWARGALDGLDPEAGVLLIGTGLTMIDVVVTLANRGHRGPLTAFSRRGLLPRRHRLDAPAVSAPPPETDNLDRLLHYLHDADGAWRSAVDALRPRTQALWQAQPVEEQRRFLRHLRPYWDVHRHRAPAPSADVVDRLCETGGLALLAARLTATHLTPEHIDATLQPRGADAPLTLSVGRVVNCTGTSLRYDAGTSPLLAALHGAGLARRHPLGLGLDVDGETGALLGADGQASQHLFTLGPTRSGALWETVAVPEIRGQAAGLATALLGM